MKRQILTLTLLILPFISLSQRISDTVQISYLYNVTILFDSEIQGEPKFGSGAAILSEKLDAQTLMIKVDGQTLQQLGKSSLPNTNMLIKTKKGIYNFILTYSKNLDNTFISPKDYKPIHLYSNEQDLKNQKQIEEDSLKRIEKRDSLYSRLLNAKQNFVSLGVKNNKMKMTMLVPNIWVTDSLIYMKITLLNSGSVPYDIEYLRFVKTTGRFKLKNSSEYTDEIEPYYSLDEVEDYQVQTDEEYHFIIAFDKFTLSKDEHFNIQIGEDNGGRQMVTSMKRDVILEAQKL